MSEPATKRPRAEEDGDNGDSKDEIIAKLKARVAELESCVTRQGSDSMTYYASHHAGFSSDEYATFPKDGMPARHVKEIIEQAHLCDFSPRLNTSSYVNVVSEPEERDVGALGAEVNLADASVYPASIKIHDRVVDMIAKKWHAPEPAVKGDNYVGAGTVGSTEACLLSGLALKFRWREWYKAKHGMTDEQVQAVKPNIVISSAYQAAWEKFFRYFDVDAKLVKASLLKDKMAINAKDLVSHVDEKTIGVVCILGNHYNGVFDPVWEVNDEIEKVNAEKGFQVGIHVDAASGGFIAPFIDMKGLKFDFRLKNVLTMSTSGHKFGESVCGTGWVIFRQREDLSSHIAVSVTYLGGHCDSITLNFSRPASGPFVQFYKMLRLGEEGYKSKVANQMNVAHYLREFIRDLKHPSGKPRFQMLDGGGSVCLPVVAARLNPELDLAYNDIDLQHAISESHWYVSGYSLGFENFMNGGIMEPLFNDVDATATMFRIVVKSNLTRSLAEDLTGHFIETLTVLDSMEEGYASMRSAKAAVQQDVVELAQAEQMTVRQAAVASVALGKWMGKRKKRFSLSQGPQRPSMLKAFSAAHVC
eukprot:CAMPEP_0197437360 /NCGR_PEP_ID=MMETSP1175-20131217/4615_1 /TAXON_ID=1003142 /ORGANISM="Triceratium dubium, Strain CCMP147" /LENGTH=587 /DNA_ID=CAMNT_0042966859 /DNA_START=92 /DNA_END=1855 /DNA_ORIENTATION=+